MRSSSSGSSVFSRRAFFQSFTGRMPEPPPPPPPPPMHFALASLRDLPEPVLRHMVPTRNASMVVKTVPAGIQFSEEHIASGTVSLKPMACRAAELFDGIQSLELVGLALEKDHQVEAGKGYAIARETFLILSASQVFYPASPPEEIEQQVRMCGKE